MLRDTAVKRIADELGFRKGFDGTTSDPAFESLVVSRLQEAQRDLEMGKTLPRFLIKLYSFTLSAGSFFTTTPTDFIRIVDADDIGTFYTADNEIGKVFLEISTAAEANALYNVSGDAGAPQTFYRLVGQSQDLLIFLPRTDADYSFTLPYYARDAVLETNIENLWLKNAPEWLIGEAGYRLAGSLRDEAGRQLFDDMRRQARANLLSEIVTENVSHGPVVMGREH